MPELALADPACKNGHAWFPVDHVLLEGKPQDGEEIETHHDQDVIACHRCGLVSVNPPAMRSEVSELARFMQDRFDAHASAKADSWRRASPYGHVEDVKRRAFRFQAAITRGDREVALRILADLANYGWMSVSVLTTKPASEAP